MACRDRKYGLVLHRKLPHFSFSCGWLMHEVKGCTKNGIDLGSNSKATAQFGSWLWVAKGFCRRSPFGRFLGIMVKERSQKVVRPTRALR